MEFSFVKMAVFAAFGLLSGLGFAMQSAPESDVLDYVDTFIGTTGTGHTYPGPTLPFGFVQPGPETGKSGWDYCSGYNYADKKILFFGQTHMNGTGCPDFGDVAFIPFAGNDAAIAGSRFDKKNERAGVGYYYVKLDDANAEVEISATERVAIYRIKFNADGGKVYLDLQSGVRWGGNVGRVKFEKSEMPDAYTVRGAQRINGFASNRSVCFEMKFDKPAKSVRKNPPVKDKFGEKYLLDFGLKSGDTLLVKIALSTVSPEGAMRNMAAELPDWNFDAVVENARAKWLKILSKFEVKADLNTKKAFYTSVYHLFVQPNNIADVDGQYDDATGKTAKSMDGNYFSSWSLWDTYRAAHPLYTILIPEVVPSFVNSMLMHYDAVGYLPVNVYWGKETYCMIGNHAISVIGEAVNKGFGGFDKRRALEAMVVSSTVPHKKSAWNEYLKYGYFPFDLRKTESVSSTLEVAYNDSCVARAAEKIGDKKVAAEFRRRSLFYKNLFDPETKFMRGKDSSGKWREPFNPFDFSHEGSLGGDYTEGSAWQYTWHVQQDVAGLIALFGGNKPFVERLEGLFTARDTRVNARKSVDISGLIGQYVHGNEPSHHIAYMFALADAPERTQEIVREVCDKFYMPAPDGLCGNDDCGQMSAWYIFACLGFYPVDPCSGEYVLGAPQAEEISINLKNGGRFTVLAKNFSKRNKYVKSVKLDGKPYSNKTIAHADIMRGGVLEFEMSPEPNRAK